MSEYEKEVENQMDLCFGAASLGLVVLGFVVVLIGGLFL